MFPYLFSFRFAFFEQHEIQKVTPIPQLSHQPINKNQQPSFVDGIENKQNLRNPQEMFGLLMFCNLPSRSKTNSHVALKLVCLLPKKGHRIVFQASHVVRGKLLVSRSVLKSYCKLTMVCCSCTCWFSRNFENPSHGGKDETFTSNPWWSTLRRFFKTRQEFSIHNSDAMYFCCPLYHLFDERLYTRCLWGAKRAINIWMFP